MVRKRRCFGKQIVQCRTSGLFKLEYEDCIILLTSKRYYCDSNKFSSKNINKKQNTVTKQRYLNDNATQKLVGGFKAKKNQMNTYS